MEIKLTINRRHIPRIKKLGHLGSDGKLVHGDGLNHILVVMLLLDILHHLFDDYRVEIVQHSPEKAAVYVLAALVIGRHVFYKLGNVGSGKVPHMLHRELCVLGHLEAADLALEYELLLLRQDHVEKVQLAVLKAREIYLLKNKVRVWNQLTRLFSRCL
jgi:hypothetical protein